MNDTVLVGFQLRRHRRLLQRGDTTYVPAGSTPEECLAAIEKALADDQARTEVATTIREAAGLPAAATTGGRDWAKFFAALAQFFAVILPIILQLFGKPGIPLPIPSPSPSPSPGPTHSAIGGMPTDFSIGDLANINWQQLLADATTAIATIQQILAVLKATKGAG